MEIKTYWAVGIGFVLVILIYLSMRNGSGSATVQPSFEVVGGVSPEIASLRTSEKIAELNTKDSMFANYLGYLLGIDGGYRTENIARISADSQVQTTQIESDAAKVLGQISADAQRYGYDASVNIANREAAASETAARYNYEAVHQQEKSKRVASTWGGIGKIASGILGIFGL